MWLTSYWFSSRSTINIIFSFINNYSQYQQFIKQFVSLSLFFTYIFFFGLNYFTNVFTILFYLHLLLPDYHYYSLFPCMSAIHFLVFLFLSKSLFLLSILLHHFFRLDLLSPPPYFLLYIYIYIYLYVVSSGAFFYSFFCQVIFDAHNS